MIISNHIFFLNYYVRVIYATLDKKQGNSCLCTNRTITKREIVVPTLYTYDCLRRGDNDTIAGRIECIRNHFLKIDFTHKEDSIFLCNISYVR